MVILFCVMAACVATASFISVATCFVCKCVCWSFFRRCERDLELGNPMNVHRGRVSDSNYRTLEVSSTGSGRGEEERMEQRMQALEKLLPLVKYGSSSNGELKMVSNYEDCSICLDDYRDGEVCRVFPVCKHVFHVKCIDHWLKNHLTCPVCRKCLLDSS